MVIYEEHMPLPYVYYVDFYGAFIGFSQKAELPIYFCLCAKQAITNYVKQFFQHGYQCLENDLPQEFVQTIPIKDLYNEESLLKYFHYKFYICHKCFKSVPYKFYCAPMYGGVFSQNFGWYINQVLFGLSPFGKSESKQIKRQAENEVRKDFGFGKIGSKKITEWLLFMIVRSIFTDKEVLYCTRPSVLQGLELDIYIPAISLAFEYQGKQHYKPVKHWGGKKALDDLKKRDAKKKRLCKKYNIKLITINHRSVVNRSVVIEKLKKANVGV